MAAERYIFASGTTSAVVNIPDGIEPNKLIVIDFIEASSVAGTSPHSIDFEGSTFWRYTTGAGGNSVHLEWAGGWPIWSASGSDLAPMTSLTITLTATAASAATLLVGFHYERLSDRRTQGQ